ncbi:stage II sporulation protein M [Chloroflexota bacterium]
MTSYKWWLLIAVLLFSTGLIMGLITPGDLSDIPAEELAALEDLADLLATLPKTSVFVIIFFKNVSALLISFLLSPLFYLVPVMALTFNGWLVGFLSATVLQEKSLGYLLAGLLPHGIFELPAFIIGEAAALSFATTLILALLKKDRRNLVLPNFKRSLRYLTIAFVLLLPAAIIETYITPLFLK